MSIFQARCRSIGMQCFRHCVDLKNVQLPAGITAIEDGVFQDCLSIDTLNLPESVSEIGNDAFGNCPELRRIKLLE